MKDSRSRHHRDLGLHKQDKSVKEASLKHYQHRKKASLRAAASSTLERKDGLGHLTEEGMGKLRASSLAHIGKIVALDSLLQTTAPENPKATKSSGGASKTAPANDDDGPPLAPAGNPQKARGPPAEGDEPVAGGPADAAQEEEKPEAPEKIEHAERHEWNTEPREKMSREGLLGDDGLGDVALDIPEKTVPISIGEYPGIGYLGLGYDLILGNPAGDPNSKKCICLLHCSFFS